MKQPHSALLASHARSFAFLFVVGFLFLMWITLLAGVHVAIPLGNTVASLPQLIEGTAQQAIRAIPPPPLPQRALADRARNVAATFIEHYGIGAGITGCFVIIPCLVILWRRYRVP